MEGADKYLNVTAEREGEIPRKTNRDWKDQDEGHLACWLAGNANDVENAVQKKSQMRIMEEQLSKNRTGR